MTGYVWTIPMLLVDSVGDVRFWHVGGKLEFKISKMRHQYEGE